MALTNMKMHNGWKSVAFSAGLGAVTGMRSMSGLALLSGRLAGGTGAPRPRNQSPSVLSSPWTRRVLTTLAAAEMAADKTSVVPDRTSAVSLAGRAVVGAAAGVAAANLSGGRQWVGALAGASTAVAATYIFFHLRKAATERLALPDWMAAIPEDALVLFAGSRIAAALSNERP